MMLVPTYLDRSEIHGLGVFAREFIARGVRIWELHPLLDVRLSPEEHAALPPVAYAEVEMHGFRPEANGPIYYEAMMGKYMNHSREPNTDFTALSFGVTTRDIQPGEELTCDYHQLVHDFHEGFLRSDDP